MDLLARTGVGRDVNRHHYTTAEINADLARPVVRALGRLIRFRPPIPWPPLSPAYAGARSRFRHA